MDISLSADALVSTAAEILKLVFERTSKGTRITEASVFAPDKVIRTELPLFTTSV
jgi:hypothetical protein